MKSKLESPTKFKTASPMKKLTCKEMQNRRTQGLCFNCDEKFTPGHRCKGSQLLLLEANNECTDDEKTNGSLGKAFTSCV